MLLLLLLLLLEEEEERWRWVYELGLGGGVRASVRCLNPPSHLPRVAGHVGGVAKDGAKGEERASEGRGEQVGRRLRGGGK